MKLLKNALITATALSALTLLSGEAVIRAVEKTVHSEVTVEFIEDTSTTPVRDPEDPEVELENPSYPEDPNGDAGSGPLSLDYVSPLQFGEQKISMFEQTYDSTTQRPFIQVTDKRATSDGWLLTAQASAFTLVDEEGNPVDGEELSDVTLTLWNGDTMAAAKENLYEPASLTSNQIAITAGDSDPVPVASAASGAGRDTWLLRWLGEDATDTNSKVTLTVPGGKAKAGTYTSTLTWTLQNAPQE